MKCENCGSELVGASIVCRQCNHNNAQGRVSQWRARRTGELQQPSSTRSISPLPDTPKAESPKPTVRNSKPLGPIRPAPIPFEPRIRINHASPSAAPKTSSSSSQAAEGRSTAHSADEQEPPWRAQLKEKVKQARERKTVGATALDIEPDEAEMDPNPIVESALKRIQWANHTPSSTSAPRIVRRGSQAAALAAEEDYEPEPEVELKSKSLVQPGSKTETTAGSKTEPKPAVRVTPTPTNPLLARKATTQPVTRPETKPLPSRQAAMPNRPQAPPQAEARIEIKPAEPQAEPAVENKTAEPGPRITGEIKKPVPPPAPAVKSQPEKTAYAKPRTPIATEVVGLPKSASAAKAAERGQAKLWVRTLAGMCDFEVIAVAFLPLFGSYATLNTSLGRESFAIMFFLLATLTFCYQLLMLTLADRTTGMACLNLKLVNVAGGNRPISGTQKFARAVAATAAFLCPPLNLIVMQSNQQRYTLPDLLSGTALVEK